MMRFQISVNLLLQSFPIVLHLTPRTRNRIAKMASTLFDLNKLSVNPQSPAISSPGLDDLDSNVNSYFGTNNVNVDADEEVDHAINNLELNQEGGSLQLETPVRKKELTSPERLAAYQYLLKRMEDGVLKRGSTTVVAGMFGVRIRSIQRLWKRARESGTHDHQTGRVRNYGRKRIEFDLERIREIPLRRRTTIRSLAFDLGMSRQFIMKKLKVGSIRCHTNAIKPSLIQDNLSSRIKHCLSNIDPTTVPHQPTFNHMQNTIHIDEKWFYLSKRSQRYYLLRDENDLVRTIKNSNFIPKVMFLAVVARPRYNINDICTFDGKIRVFPLVEYVAAVRSSQNRTRGTLEVKPITNVTRNMTREFMIGKVLPAIADKWPRESSLERIFIQQDNAKTHIHHDDVEFCCAVKASGRNVSVVCQPLNSPDLNVLDLGFFRAIQSLQSKECAKSIVELLVVVEDAYQPFSEKKNNYIFFTLQTCMIEVLKCDGSNIYKIPHIKKKALARLGVIPSTIQCPTEVFANAVALISP